MLKKASIVSLASLLLATMSTYALPQAPTSSVDSAGALREIIAISSHIEGTKVFKAAGNSMLPHYGDNSILLVKEIDFKAIKSGMIVVYRDSENELVGHLVTHKLNGNLITKGATNKSIDPNPVSINEVVGVIIGTFHTTGIVNAPEMETVIGKKF